MNERDRAISFPRLPRLFRLQEALNKAVVVGWQAGDAYYASRDVVALGLFRRVQEIRRIIVRLINLEARR